MMILLMLLLCELDRNHCIKLQSVFSPHVTDPQSHDGMLFTYLFTLHVILFYLHLHLLVVQVLQVH